MADGSGTFSGAKPWSSWRSRERAPVSAFPAGPVAADGSAARLVFLDGWRGLAILLVLAGHFAQFLPHTVAPAGVELFFVLSGRLMADILIVRRHKLPSFIARRAARILPALFCYVLVLFVVMCIAMGPDSFGRVGLGAAAAAMFFENYLPGSAVVSAYEHTWSLAVEEHSYLLLAGLALAVARDRKAAMIAALALAALALLNGVRLRAESLEDAQYLYWRTDVRAASILLAFGAFLWAQDFFRSSRSAWWRWASPFCFVAGLALLVLADAPVRFSAGTALLAIAVATLDVADARFRRLFEARALTWLGIVSFSVYLWQQPFFLSVLNGGPAVPAIAGSFVFALASFHWIEKPARARLNAYWPERSAARGARAPLAPSA